MREPSRLVLVCELSGAFGLSTHNRKQPYQFNNAPAVMSFVDSHVSYIPIYWNGVKGFDGISAFYEPPAGYDYKWTEEYPHVSIPSHPVRFLGSTSPTLEEKGPFVPKSWNLPQAWQVSLGF